MKNMKMLLIAGSILPMFHINAQAAEAECVEAKDCAQMGYTVNVADCVGSALKCPWDLTKAMCKTEAQTDLPILYGDGTVESRILAGKTPVGIVIDTENKLAVALTNVKMDGSAGKEAMFFSNVEVDTALANCTSSGLDSGCGSDGRANTDILLKITSGTYYAAQACNKYEPVGCTTSFCKKGKWFLPSYQEFEKMVKVKGGREALDGVLNDLNGQRTAYLRHWTSTEYDQKEQWTKSVWRMASVAISKAGASYYERNGKCYVRPFVKYN